MDNLTAGLERDNPEGEHMTPKRARHILTPEERRKGSQATNAKLATNGKRHRLTRDQCASGAHTVAAMVLFNRAKRHPLTAEDRRRGGLATAAKRRAKRAADLIALALPAFPAGATIGYRIEGEFPPAGAPAKRDTEAPKSLSTLPEVLGSALLPGEDSFDSISSATRELMGVGASLASKLMEPPRPSGDAEDLYLPREYERETPIKLEVASGVLTTDPFILSALKRFRLGPLNPLSLTRSQRAQVDLMVSDGWLEVTGDSMLQLTSKGRGAIQENAS